MTSATTSPRFAVDTHFVDRLAVRANATEQLRQLPAETIADARRSGLFDILLPERYGGQQAPFPALLEPIRRLAHGCTSSAWTLGFFALHNWMLALFDEQAQDEIFSAGAVLAPAPLAPSGRGTPVDGGYLVDGRWSWATGIMHADWVIVGCLLGSGESMFPALAAIPVGEVTVEDVWHTAGMRGTGSNDVIVEGVFVPQHRIVAVAQVYAGTSPGARLHDSDTYRWPIVSALALAACMPVLGTAERVVDLFAERLGERMLSYGSTAQRDQPAAQMRLSEARLRLASLDTLVFSVADTIQSAVRRDGAADLRLRARARSTAAYVVHGCRAVIGDVVGAAGASAQFLDNPLQRAKRDVDIVAGHAVFDYDVSRELDGALQVGGTISPIAML
ncbi:alkylation response protein AidB-like acyl-CoA dehydrogenase [Mycolicibacterium iranicum]|uniref:Alkylation response protein AidB-like acyl-CoA dehydrogenase n=1 Tax=Mycolicibacterium iranicum TaxID=912594 RepID=A0A839QB57_MYCIR|nr:acyl-CoA dehydrogenase family protein [Mycolicibacterium iranicum]MBB2989771.1 alkylation response protein AidB-like acyl-CoA dehydrogenase [Mycolicibacterium iranicum]